jgi:hypothetical protein
MPKLNYLNLKDGELDKNIYRIMSEQHVFTLFADKKNVLSAVKNWKDKFENFQLKLGGVLDGKAFGYGFVNDLVGQCWTRHSLSEAMWGIYANDPSKRYLRIRSTPRKLLTALVDAHPEMPHDTCFVGGVEYKKEKQLRTFLKGGGDLHISPTGIATSLLLKRHAFKHESEVRLIYFGDAKNYDTKGLYRYTVNPNEMITQIMADPNRDRKNWRSDRSTIEAATGFHGEIKRSKIYDPPDWAKPEYNSSK